MFKTVYLLFSIETYSRPFILHGDFMKTISNFKNVFQRDLEYVLVGYHVDTKHRADRT